VRSLRAAVGLTGQIAGGLVPFADPGRPSGRFRSDIEPARRHAPRGGVDLFV